MTGKGLIRSLRRRAKADGRTFNVNRKRGKGSHAMVSFGERRSFVPLHGGELPPGTRRAILRQLGVRPEELESEEWPMHQRSPCAYRATLTPEPEGGFTVTFPDVPEAITYGADEREAMEMASEVLELAIVARMEQGEDLPSQQSGASGDSACVIEAAAREQRPRSTMRCLAARSRRANWARRLGVDEAIVRRMLDPRARDPRRQLGRCSCRLGPASSGNDHGGASILAPTTDGKPTLSREALRFSNPPCLRSRGSTWTTR